MRPEHHDPDCRGNEKQAEMLNECRRDEFHRRWHILANLQPREQKNQPNYRARNERYQESRKNFAEPLKQENFH